MILATCRGWWDLYAPAIVALWAAALALGVAHGLQAAGHASVAWALFGVTEGAVFLSAAGIAAVLGAGHVAEAIARRRHRSGHTQPV